MVTERADTPDAGGEQDTQGVLDLTPPGADVPDPGVVDEAPVSETVDTPEAHVAETSVAPVSDPTATTPEETPTPPAPQVDATSFSELQTQVKAQQEQLQYYSQLEQQSQLERQTAQWQQELEQQGYLPEQARYFAQDRASRTQEAAQLQKQAEDFRVFKEGQRAAALHFAKQHKLGLDDLSSLERFNTPQEMEVEAKRISETRSLKAELAALKQSQVPAQSFDSNDAPPAATGSEDNLLDKYIAGDRSPAAVAAAARLLG